MLNKESKKIAEAVMAGAKLKRSGKPMPYFEGKESLDFSEGKPEKSNIKKSFESIPK
jgi:hypothetical protein